MSFSTLKPQQTVKGIYLTPLSGWLYVIAVMITAWLYRDELFQTLAGIADIRIMNVRPLQYL
jgi:hypothetical protein